MAAKALSAKHKRFVAEYLKDLNETQAYIRAGYAAANADANAHRLMGKDGVRAAIEAGQAKLAGKLELTAEAVLKNLEAARSLAMGEGQCSAAIRACELQGKHIGMFVERSEHSGPGGGPIRVLGDIDRAARIAGLLGQAVKRKDGAEA